MTKNSPRTMSAASATNMKYASNRFSSLLGHPFKIREKLCPKTRRYCNFKDQHFIKFQNMLAFGQSSAKLNARSEAESNMDTKHGGFLAPLTGDRCLHLPGSSEESLLLLATTLLSSATTQTPAPATTVDTRATTVDTPVTTVDTFAATLTPAPAPPNSWLLPNMVPAIGLECRH